MSSLEVTEVNVHVRRDPGPEDPLVGFARITLNDAFVVNGIRLVKGKFGLFISFPREYNKQEGKGFNICFPIHQDAHKVISDAVLNEYQRQAKA